MANETKPAAKTADKLTPVEFTKHWTRYNKGEVAGFKPDEAKRLIEKLKVAKAYAPAKEEPKK